MFDLAVIGAGAAGMMAAGTAQKRGLDVAIIERNQKVGRKLMITGKGRCNVTNACNLDRFIANIPTNGRFLYSAFDGFSSEDVMDFFEDSGVELKTERGNRVFPCSDKASDIVDALYKYIKNCRLFFNTRVKNIQKENDLFKIFDEQSKEILRARNVVIATGGASYPLTGSSGDGYALAEGFGHKCAEIKPSLVPLQTEEDCSELMGLSLKNCRLTVIDTKKNKKVFSDFGELLFTHFGISGPLVLSASAHLRPMEKGRYVCSIDFKPALDEKTLDNRIQRDFNENLNRDFGNSLSKLLPASSIKEIVRRSGIPFDTKVNQITREQRKDLLAVIKDFKLTIKDFMPVEQAIITSGGISVKEINPKTMESKLVPGLYFAGEIIDVDAYTGGFNLQIAFSTGHLAGISVI